MDLTAERLGAKTPMEGILSYFKWYGIVPRPGDFVISPFYFSGINQ
jgi:hypothetical protein